MTTAIATGQEQAIRPTKLGGKGLGDSEEVSLTRDGSEGS